jgi:hypothetical protein
MRVSPTRGSWAFVALASAALLLAAAPARADKVGVRTGVYTNLGKPFVGFELLFPVSHSVYLNPNVEYVFIDRRPYLTFNADFHYDFHTHSRAYVWAGAGLGVIYQNPDGPAPSDTDVGANFLFGVGVKGDVIPYVQAKLLAKDDTEFVLGIGLRF